MQSRAVVLLFALGSSSPFASACNEATPAPVAPVTTVMLDAGGSATSSSMPVDPSDGGEAFSGDAQAGDFFSCAVDSDCVTVAKNSCCNNGFKEAVNKQSVGPYKASFTCPPPRKFCPMFRINDMRLPRCNNDTHRCELYRPDASAPGP